MKTAFAIALLCTACAYESYQFPEPTPETEATEREPLPVIVSFPVHNPGASPGCLNPLGSLVEFILDHDGCGLHAQGWAGRFDDHAPTCEVTYQEFDPNTCLVVAVEECPDSVYTLAVYINAEGYFKGVIDVDNECQVDLRGRTL